VLNIIVILTNALAYCRKYRMKKNIYNLIKICEIKWLLKNFQEKRQFCINPFKSFDRTKKDRRASTIKTFTAVIFAVS
jgi:hypothetical protein